MTTPQKPIVDVAKSLSPWTTIAIDLTCAGVNDPNLECLGRIEYAGGFTAAFSELKALLKSYPQLLRPLPDPITLVVVAPL